VRHALTACSASAVDHTHWRRQIVTVRNANRVEPLAELTVGTGLTAPPAKPWPSRWAPRASSLAFHPTEMLYTLGQPNGSRAYLACCVCGGTEADAQAVRIFGCDLTPSESDTEIEPGSPAEFGGDSD
jgi:hypothetical protein